MGLRLSIVFSTCALMCAVVVALPAGAESTRERRGADAWLTYGQNDQLTNNLDERMDGSSLKVAWQAHLDGKIWGSALYTRGRVYAATAAGSVYAVDAATGQQLWRRPLGAVQHFLDDCGSWGITSTPAIDPQRNLLYAIGGDGLLHALDLDDGAEAAGFPIRLTDRPAVEYVWGALRVIDGKLYAGIASYCDQKGTPDQEADGRVIALDLDTGEISSLDMVPGPGNLGGVWGYGGISTDGTYLYTGVGNADSPEGEGAGYGDQLVQFTTDLDVIAANRPPQVKTEGDFDFGASPVLFRPAGCPAFAAANNKIGSAFVWRTDDIAAGPVSTLPIADGSPFLGAPAWSSQLGLLVFSAAKASATSSGAGVAAYSVDDKCSFKRAWATPTGAGVQPPPIVVGTLVFTSAGSGGIYALDGKNGHVVWHQATETSASAPLSAGDRRVYAPVGSTLEAIASG